VAGVYYISTLESNQIVLQVHNEYSILRMVYCAMKDGININFAVKFFMLAERNVNDVECMRLQAAGMREASNVYASCQMSET